MALKDLDEFLTVEPLTLTVHGTEYEFPGEVSAESWLYLQAVAEQLRTGRRDDEAMSDVDQTALMAEMFGPAKDDLIAAGCTSAEMQHIFRTLFAFHFSGGGELGLQHAERVWESRGEAPAPNREARRSKSPRPRGSHASSQPKKPPARRGATSSPGGTS